MTPAPHYTAVRSNGSRAQTWWQLAIISWGFLLSQATTAAERGTYLGVSIGASNLKGSVNDVNSFSGIANPSESTLTSEGASYSLFGGFRFNEYLALEYGFEHLGGYDYHVGYRVAYPCIYPCAPTAYPPGDFSMTVNAHKLQARGSWPVSDRWTLDAALGVGLSPTTSDDPFLVTYDWAGVGRIGSTFALVTNAGASFKISPRWWTRFELSYLAAPDGPPLGSDDIETVRLSAEYRFLGK